MKSGLDGPPNPLVPLALAISIGIVSFKVFGPSVLANKDALGPFATVLFFVWNISGNLLAVLLAPLLLLPSLSRNFREAQPDFMGATLPLLLVSVGFWGTCAHSAFSQRHSDAPRQGLSAGMAGWLSITLLLSYSIGMALWGACRNAGLGTAYNAFEVILWGSIGAYLLVVRARAPTVMRRNLTVSGISFFFFAASDVVEIQTGAWWSPWWLLVWKALCVAVLLATYFSFKRM